MHLLPSRHPSSHLLVCTLILISAPHEAARDQESPRNKLMAAAEEGKRLKNVPQGMGKLERVKLSSSVPECLGRAHTHGTKARCVPGLWHSAETLSPDPAPSPCWTRNGKPGACPHHWDKAAMPSAAAAARRNGPGGAVRRPASQLPRPKAASTALK